MVCGGVAWRGVVTTRLRGLYGTYDRRVGSSTVFTVGAQAEHRRSFNSLSCVCTRQTILIEQINRCESCQQSVLLVDGSNC